MAGYAPAKTSTRKHVVKVDRRSQMMMRDISALTMDTQMGKISNKAAIMAGVEDDLSVCSDPTISGTQWDKSLPSQYLRDPWEHSDYDNMMKPQSNCQQSHSTGNKRSKPLFSKNLRHYLLGKASTSFRSLSSAAGKTWSSYRDGGGIMSETGATSTMTSDMDYIFSTASTGHSQREFSKPMQRNSPRKVPKKKSSGTNQADENRFRKVSKSQHRIKMEKSQTTPRPRSSSVPRGVRSNTSPQKNSTRDQPRKKKVARRATASACEPGVEWEYPKKKDTVSESRRHETKAAAASKTKKKKKGQPRKRAPGTSNSQSGSVNPSVDRHCPTSQKRRVSRRPRTQVIFDPSDLSNDSSGQRLTI